MPEQMAVAPPPPPDQSARERIRRDLETTLFVEAGAGSGKTSALVQRVLALVLGGHVELRRIAAITFTEKAGAELRDRIRAELEKAAEADPDGDRGTALARPWSNSTARPSARSIRLPSACSPNTRSRQGFRRGSRCSTRSARRWPSTTRWSSFRDELLADPQLERTLLLLFASGVKETALRSLAEAFDDNWDLVRERVPAAAPDPPSVHQLFASAAEAIRHVCATPCHDPSDKLRERLDEIAQRMAELAAMRDELDLLEALGPFANPKLPSFRVGGRGKKGSWDCDLADLRASVVEAGEALESVRGGSRQRVRPSNRQRHPGVHVGQCRGPSAGRPVGVPRFARPGPSLAA